MPNRKCGSVRKTWAQLQRLTFTLEVPQLSQAVPLTGATAFKQETGDISQTDHSRHVSPVQLTQECSWFDRAEGSSHPIRSEEKGNEGNPVSERQHDFPHTCLGPDSDG